MRKCMADHSTSGFNFRLNHFGGTKGHQVLCFPSTVGAGKNGSAGIYCSQALNGKFGRLNFWKRHDNYG